MLVNQGGSGRWRLTYSSLVLVYYCSAPQLGSKEFEKDYSSKQCKSVRVQGQPNRMLLHMFIRRTNNERTLQIYNPHAGTPAERRYGVNCSTCKSSVSYLDNDYFYSSHNVSRAMCHVAVHGRSRQSTDDLVTDEHFMSARVPKNPLDDFN